VNIYIKYTFLISGLVLAGCSQPGRNNELPDNRRIDHNKETKGSKANDNKSIKPLAIDRFLKPGNAAETPTGQVALQDSIMNTPEYCIARTQAEIENEIKATGIRSKSIPIGSKDYVSRQYQVWEAYSRIKKSRTNSNSYLSITFDNDIFDNTDYYYTSGLKIELFNPALSFLPLSKALLPDWHATETYYGINLVQNLYTPVNPDTADIQYGDRPFASYLYLGHSKITNDPVRKIRLTSEFDLGVLGPAGLGGVVQSTIHDIRPTGWVNQIKNDIVANYSATFEKGILTGDVAELTGKISAQAGTLYDNLTIGLKMRVGNFDSYFRSIYLMNASQERKSIHKKIRYQFVLSVDNRFVGYDATLQGGIFNRNNVYYLRSTEICNYVFSAMAGFGIGIGRFSLEAEQIYLTPEFKAGKSHLWGRLKTTFQL
jgi:lipid A 3-O-deacylase